MSRQQLEANLAGLIAATGLPNAFYGWQRSPDGKTGYSVELEQRRNTEILVRPSFFYQLSPNEPSRGTFRLNTTAIWKDAYKARLLADFYVGGDPSMFVEYYHPFDGSAYFVAPGGSLQHIHNYIYDGKARSDRTSDRFATWLYFGIGTWRQLQFRTGVQAGYDKYSNPVPTNGLDATNTSFVNPEIKGIINNQDSGQLPTRGFRLNATAGWSFRDHSYPYVQMNFDNFQPVGRALSLFATGQTDSSLGRKLTFYDQFTSGGLTQLDAYRYQELRADTLLSGGVGVLYRGANPNNAMFRPIFGSWYQVAGLDSFSGNSQFNQSGTLGIFTPTPLGVAALTFSVDFTGSTRVRLSIGSFWNRP